MSEPSVAPDGLDKVTITVSLPSTKASSTIEAMVIVSSVSPAVIVSVPLANV